MSYSRSAFLLQEILLYQPPLFVARYQAKNPVYQGTKQTGKLSHCEHFQPLLILDELFSLQCNRNADQMF